MQKIFSPVLNGFIEKFRLLKTNGTIVFDSIVNFKSGDSLIEHSCTVHIICLDMQKLNVIYLFYCEPDRNKIPELIPINSESNLELRANSLVVHGKSRLHGEYEIEITPRDNAE